MTQKHLKRHLQAEIKNAGYSIKIKKIGEYEGHMEIFFDHPVPPNTAFSKWLNDRFTHGVTLYGSQVLINTPKTLHEDLIDMVKVIKEYEYEKLMPITKIALDSLLKRIK